MLRLVLRYRTPIKDNDTPSGLFVQDKMYKGQIANGYPKFTSLLLKHSIQQPTQPHKLPHTLFWSNTNTNTHTHTLTHTHSHTHTHTHTHTHVTHTNTHMSHTHTRTHTRTHTHIHTRTHTHTRIHTKTHTRTHTHAHTHAHKNTHTQTHTHTKTHTRTHAHPSPRPYLPTITHLHVSEYMVNSIIGTFLPVGKFLSTLDAGTKVSLQSNFSIRY